MADPGGPFPVHIARPVPYRRNTRPGSGSQNGQRCSVPGATVTSFGVLTTCDSTGMTISDIWRLMRNSASRSILAGQGLQDRGVLHYAPGFEIMARSWSLCPLSAHM